MIMAHLRPTQEEYHSVSREGRASKANRHHPRILTPAHRGGDRCNVVGQSEPTLLPRVHPLLSVRGGEPPARTELPLPDERLRDGLLLRNRYQGDHRSLPPRRRPQPSEEGSEPAAGNAGRSDWTHRGLQTLRLLHGCRSHQRRLGHPHRN